ncbi:MAG: Rpn family recombination-promoting nuclease/putative transposase [Planctomycetota bacterium]
MTKQPHDALFKASLTPEAARALCRAVLPPALASVLGGAELRQEGTDFIEENLKERRSDVLFSARLGERETLVYVLAEAQSTNEPLMTFRVLRYMVRIWSWWLERQAEAGNQNPKTLPLIVPVVVYTGEGHWSAPVSFQELIDLPSTLARADALAVVPNFRFVLDDLTRTTDPEIRARQAPPFATVSWVFLRRSHDPERGVEVWRGCGDLVRDVLERHPEWHGWLEQLVRYSLLTGMGTPEELREELRRIGGPEAEEVTVTAGEKLLEEVRTRAREDGERRLLLRQLREIFGPLSAAVERRVAHASEADLESWALRVLKAPSLDAVFGAPSSDEDQGA